MALKPLTRELENEVLAQLDLTTKQLELDLTLFKSWVEQQHHLPSSRLKENDTFLISFLIGCKGSIERSKRKFDLYYTLRRGSELFFNRDPFSDTAKGNDECFECVALPQAVFTGSRVTITRLTNKSTELFDFMGILQRFIIAGELRIREEGIAGPEYCVLDAQFFTASHLTQINPQLLREFLVYLQEAIPIRSSMYLLINCPSYFETLMNKFVKPFVKKKIAERIMVCQNESLLLETFPIEVLPKDYGGKEVSMKELNDFTLKKLKEKRHWFTCDLAELTDESKRPKESPPNKNPYLGIQGSIKNLSID